MAEGLSTTWICRVCKLKVEHSGAPPGWLWLSVAKKNSKVPPHFPTLGVFCGRDCNLVAAMRCYGSTEAEVREWIANVPAWDES